MPNTEKNSTEKKLKLFDQMIEDRCEVFGMVNTIQFLFDNGFTEKDLLDMQFDQADIEAAVVADSCSI